MKILHTSDWHLGKMIYGRSLLEDQAHFIEQVFFPALEEHRPDAVILAGDIFDRPIAPVEAIRLFDTVLTRMHAMDIPLLAISGNHDGADRIAIGASMLRQSGIHLATRLEDCFHPVEWNQNGDTVRVYLFPYCEPAEIRQFLQDEELRGFPGTYGAMLAKIREQLDPNAVNLLVAHCFVTGSQTCDSESAVYVGGSGEISASLFDDFDYVALGHLHGPQRAGKQGRYCGSPLKYSFDEEHQNKSMTLLTIEGKEIQQALLPIPPRRDMRTVRGTLDNLLEQGKQAPCEDYLFFQITDPVPVYMPAEQLRPYYPNLLAIHCDWLYGETQAEENSQEILREQLVERRMEESTVLEQFLQQICGTEMMPVDKELFLQVLESVRKEEFSGEGGAE